MEHLCYTIIVHYPSVAIADSHRPTMLGIRENRNLNTVLVASRWSAAVGKVTADLRRQ